jgi:hypothetical protein
LPAQDTPNQMPYERLKQPSCSVFSASIESTPSIHTNCSQEDRCLDYGFQAGCLGASNLTHHSSRHVRGTSPSRDDPAGNPFRKPAALRYCRAEDKTGAGLWMEDVLESGGYPCMASWQKIRRRYAQSKNDQQGRSAFEGCFDPLISGFGNHGQDTFHRFAIHGDLPNSSFDRPSIQRDDSGDGSVHYFDAGGAEPPIAFGFGGRMDFRASEQGTVASHSGGTYGTRLRREPRGDPNITIRLLEEETSGWNQFAMDNYFFQASTKSPGIPKHAPTEGSLLELSPTCGTSCRGSDNLRLAFQENIAHTSGLFFDDPDAFTVHGVKPPANDDHRYSNLLTVLRERGLTVVTNQYYETPDFCHYIQSTVSPRPLAPSPHTAL